jgi:hypothetical protein
MRLPQSGLGLRSHSGRPSSSQFTRLDPSGEPAEALGMVDLREAAAAAGVPDNNRQARLKVWMDAVVARAAELMPMSWDKRLGGNDIFLTDNLNAVTWSVFID